MLTSSTNLILVTILALSGSTFALSSTNCAQFDRDECGLGGRCVAGTTTSICVCFQGYIRSTSTFGCRDINECAYTSSSLCANGFCRNMDGTYYCNCFHGYVPHYPDGKSCRRQNYIGPYGIPNWDWASLFYEHRK